jgi:hypothetical protein
MKAFHLHCKFIERGVECHRAPLDGSRCCGCRREQKQLVFRTGLSRSHRRNIIKQVQEQRA